MKERNKVFVKQNKKRIRTVNALASGAAVNGLRDFEYEVSLY
jgi:hypothetical protein